MAVEDILAVLVGTLILSGLVIITNYAERNRQTKWLRQAIMVSLMGLSVLMILGVGLQVMVAYNPDVDEVDPLDTTSAWIAFVLAVGTTLVMGALLFRSFREAIAVFFPRYEASGEFDAVEASLPMRADDQIVTTRLAAKSATEGTPLFPQMLNYYTAEATAPPQPIPAQAAMRDFPVALLAQKRKGSGTGYNPSSVVHTVAMMLCVLLLGAQFVGFILSGGLEGVAESYSEGLSALDVILSGLPQMIIPILGVGIGIRRNLPQTLKRLGLEMPTLEGLGAAVGATFVMLIFIIVVGVTWQLFVSEETYQEQNQASEAMSESINTIWMALLISVSAGVTEEIAFRGALQPVFGLWPTAILFALFHLQYTLTPATLIILFVAVAFGWLRQRYNTTVAILAHFMYDFVQLALVVSIPEETESWLHLLIR